MNLSSELPISDLLLDNIRHQNNFIYLPIMSLHDSDKYDKN